MGDELVALYDETSPLEQSRKSILHYHDRAEETPTYLVELPEQRIDAPRPLAQSTSRPRRSTIVNAFQPPTTREAEEQPLEDYVRRNQFSFRKSISPEGDEQLPTTNRPQSYQEGELVSPATAEDIERDLMDSKKRKNRGAESVDGYERRDSLPEEKAQKHRLSQRSENDSEPKTHRHKDSNKYEDSERRKPRSGKHGKNQMEHSRPRNEVVVMPAQEPVSVSPFSKDQKGHEKQSYSPVKVKMSVESTDEERFGNKNHRGKHHTERGKSYPSSAKRKSSQESNEESFGEDRDRTKKIHKKQANYQKSEYPTNDLEESKDRHEKSRRRRKRKERSEGAVGGRIDSRESSGRSSDDKKPRRKSLDRSIRSRSSSVCLSGESGGNSSEPYMVNSSSTKEDRPVGKHRKQPSGKDRTTGEKPSNRNEKSPPRSSHKRGTKSDDIVDYSKTTNPFGKEEPYSVHYVATKGGAGKKPDAGPEKGRTNKKDKDRKEKKGGEEANKNVAVKAPKSATKVVAKRRYHIQIPEHGRPETWFNVRFNMNADNVDMNYDGPVKINNYYASNNYN